jgi:kynurenine formamidase
MTRKEPPAGGERRADVSAAEFKALFQAVSNWGRWGEDDELGTLNELSADRIVAASDLVRSGETVTLSNPLDTEASLDNPEPAVHRMTLLPDVDVGSGTLRFTMDYIGADYHHDTHSHIDALCHVAFDGSLYNGKPSRTLTQKGAAVNTIEVVKNGLVGRGVLLDVPRLRGVPWLEPGEHVFPEDLEAAEREQAVTVAKGDILLVRTGHALRLGEMGPWDTANAKAGLHPTTVLFLAERGVAALGSDGNSDTAPSTTEEIAFPIHALTLNAMGLFLLDYLQFEDLVPACERAGRWEFLFVAAPLRIVGGTGSPLNPIAIF